MSTSLARSNGHTDGAVALQAPALPPWLIAMRQAVSDAVSPDDIKEMIQAQVKRAKEGDAKALKVVMELMGSNQPINLTQNNFEITTPAAPSDRRSRTRDLKGKIFAILSAPRQPPMTPGQIAACVGEEFEDVEQVLETCDWFASNTQGEWSADRR